MLCCVCNDFSQILLRFPSSSFSFAETINLFCISDTKIVAMNGLFHFDWTFENFSWLGPMRVTLNLFAWAFRERTFVRLCLAWQACESDCALANSLYFSSIVCHFIITEWVSACAYFFHCIVPLFSLSSSSQFKPKINDSFWRVSLLLRYFIQIRIGGCAFCQAKFTRFPLAITLSIFCERKKKIQLTELNGFSFSLKFIFLLRPIFSSSSSSPSISSSLAFSSRFLLIAYFFVLPRTVQFQVKLNQHDYAHCLSKEGNGTLYRTHNTLFGLWCVIFRNYYNNFLMH